MRSVELVKTLQKIYGKRIIIMGGGAQVGQVAIGAISEADRHNIRGEHISVDTIPLVGEQKLADAVRAVARLPRAKALVLAGSLMGGEIETAVREVRAAGAAGGQPEHGGQRAGCRRSGGHRSRAGRRDGRDGGRRHREVHTGAPEAPGFFSGCLFPCLCPLRPVLFLSYVARALVPARVETDLDGKAKASRYRLPAQR